jgi:CRP-like cAMP-binding protein
MKKFSDTERKVLASGIELRYLPDEYLFRQGQKAEFVFYLQEGSLLLESKVGFVTIDKKGVFIGIEEAIESKKHIYSAIVLAIRPNFHLSKEQTAAYSSTSS